MWWISLLACDEVGKDFENGRLHALWLKLCALLQPPALTHLALPNPLWWFFSFLTVLYMFDILFHDITTDTLGLTYLRLSFNFCLSFLLCVYFLIFVGGLFISFCVPSSFSSFVFFPLKSCPLLLLLLLCFCSSPPSPLLLFMVAYVPVNIPPPAPTCPPSLIPALTLCCSQRPPVSQAAKGAPLPPPQRLHELQT